MTKVFNHNKFWLRRSCAFKYLVHEIVQTFTVSIFSQTFDEALQQLDETRLKQILFFPWGVLTSREQPKSASYQRLKSIQGTTSVKFFNYHTVPKHNRKGFPWNSKTVFFQLETAEKTNLPFQKFQKVIGKKRRILPKNPKETLQAHETFFSNRKLQKSSVGILWKNSNISKKSRLVPFGLLASFESLVKFGDLVRDSNPRSPAPETPEN